MRVEVKVRGEGAVIHRCRACGQPIEGQPVLRHIDGRLVAFHPDHEVPK